MLKLYCFLFVAVPLCLKLIFFHSPILPVDVVLLCLCLCKYERIRQELKGTLLGVLARVAICRTSAELA
jgi:hypothetical protein